MDLQASRASPASPVHTALVKEEIELLTLAS